MKNLIKTKDIIIDSKSGFSGAGKNLEKKLKHKNLYNSTYAYGINNHRHICEIDQELYKHTKKKIKFSFNPYLLPTFRGILTSIYLKINNRNSPNKIRNELVNFYKGSKFIKILKLNSQIGSGNVINTNNCEISVCKTREKDRIIIFSAIDNLIKGAAGQAVQNMNLLYGLKETLGLKWKKFFLFLLIMLSSCSKPKTVLIAGIIFVLMMLKLKDILKKICHLR